MWSAVVVGDVSLEPDDPRGLCDEPPLVPWRDTPAPSGAMRSQPNSDEQAHTRWAPADGLRRHSPWATSKQAPGSLHRPDRAHLPAELQMRPPLRIGILVAGIVLTVVPAIGIVRYVQDMMA